VLYTSPSHTGDIKIVVRGFTLTDTLRKGGLALVSLVTDRRRIRLRERREKIIKGKSRDDLFFNYLRWLYFLIYVEEFLPGRIEVGALSSRGATVSAWGETSDYGRHLMKREVKGVTLHELAVKVEKGRVTATYVVDV